jgi:hypothetical protein
LSVVVALSRPLPEVVLPEMHHFMDEGGEYLVRLSGSKMYGIKRDLVGYFLRV